MSRAYLYVRATSWDENNDGEVLVNAYNVIIPHNEPAGNAWFGRPFDPSILPFAFAQDKLRAGLAQGQAHHR